MESDQEKDIQELVIARLRMLPDGKEISVGADGEFTKEELIEHVKLNDAIGKKMIDVEMSFLRTLKEGTDVCFGDRSGRGARKDRLCGQAASLRRAPTV